MKIYNCRIFKIIVSLFIIGIILGICSYFVLDTDYFNNQILNYFDNFELDFNYLNCLLRTIFLNLKYVILIWISGILLVSYLIVPSVILLNSISLGVSFSSIICNFGLKGILLCFIIVIPCILLNNAIYILCSYYSLNTSNKLFICLKQDKNINIKLFFKKYFIFFIIFLIILLFSSLFETYVSSNLIKFVL